MTQLSEEIFRDYQVRNKKVQKTRFIERLQRDFPDAQVEQSGLLKSRNIVLGDVDTASVVLTAHYDTCTELPIPNFIMPKNIALTLLYALVICIPIFALSFTTSFVVARLTKLVWLSVVSSYVTLIGALCLLFFGRPNKHTANDNTSGVITLLEILARLTQEERAKVALVFFDNEELGMIGSSQFSKNHKQAMKKKLLVNFDCVSDGDHIMVILGKMAKAAYLDNVKASFLPTEGKTLHIEDGKGAFYPSDQMQFPCSIAVAALNKNRFGTLYMDKIHTKKDLVFDVKNIAYIASSTCEMVRKLTA